LPLECRQEDVRIQRSRPQHLPNSSLQSLFLSSKF
jgi:hypothetical protein